MQPANECSSPVLPDHNESVLRSLRPSTLARLFQASAASSPIPAPSVPPPTRSSSSRPASRWTAQPRYAADEEPDQLLGRKPVIYLYPPFSLPDVTIELLLTSTWSFSAVYLRRRPPSRRVNIKPRNPSHGRLQQNPAARWSTRRLAQRCLTCTGKRRRLASPLFFVTLTVIDALFLPFPSLRFGFPVQVRISSVRTPLARLPLWLTWRLLIHLAHP